MHPHFSRNIVMYINSVNRSKLKVYHWVYHTNSYSAILFQPERHSFPTCQAISHLQAGEEDQVPAVIAEVRDTSIHCTVRRNIGLTAPGHGPQTQLRQGSSASGQHKHGQSGTFMSGRWGFLVLVLGTLNFFQQCEVWEPYSVPLQEFA